MFSLWSLIRNDKIWTGAEFFCGRNRPWKICSTSTTSCHFKYSKFPVGIKNKREQSPGAMVQALMLTSGLSVTTCCYSSSTLHCVPECCSSTYTSAEDTPAYFCYHSQSCVVSSQNLIFMIISLKPKH